MNAIAAPAPRDRLRFALALFVLSLIILIPSLAPTVTLWDAGEFLAASKVVGIPHPPGTPLWVLLAHTWATLLPFGSWAARVIFLTATASAVATTCFGLVAWEGLRRVPALTGGDLPRWFVPAGAMGAAIAGGFTFTNWQNSNETEVYAIAMVMIAITLWLLFRWREQRGTPQADRTLLLILYLAGLAIGNHLLALLAGPAVFAFLWIVPRLEPRPDPDERSRELATAMVVGAIWFLLIGLGLGNTWVSGAGAVLFLIAAGEAVTKGRGGFVGVALAVALIGITTYLFLYIRAGQHPILNEAAPDNWQSLLDVIRRKQYPPRGPLDDPTVRHGPNNPGRSPLLIGLQIVNYFQYFFSQWGAAFGEVFAFAWWRVPFAVAYTLLGVLGSAAHRRADKGAWWMLVVLVLTTGLGLMAYMNFKPGFSLGYDWYRTFADHEVRERDYFFVVSFVVWGMWAGMGLVLLAARMARAKSPGLRPLAAVVLSFSAIIPVAGNWKAATRAEAPMAMLARDFSYDLLNSVPPYGILITYGDNDTFPLWYAQEVEGIRPDVTVVCLALAQTDWYMRELRRQPVRPFVDSAAAPVWRGHAGPIPSWPLHTMTDAEIAAVAGSLHSVDRATPIQLGPIAHTIPAGAVLAPNDIALLRIFQQNLGRRPIAWSVSTGRNFLGLDQYIVQQGLAYTLSPGLPDSTDARYGPRAAAAVLFDIPATIQLVDNVYRYAGLDAAPGRAALDPAAEGVAGNIAQPVLILGFLLQTRGDLQGAVKYLELADRIRPDPQVHEQLMAFRQALLSDSSQEKRP